MTDDESEEYYARRAQRELDLAAAATDLAVKKIHLNAAARYATLSELAARTRAESGNEAG